jgi:hypothetical protein
MELKLSILLIIVIVNPNFVVSNEWNCDVYFQFAKVCDRFDFNGDFCHQWDTSQCEILKTSYNDYRCPTYLCVSF